LRVVRVVIALGIAGIGAAACGGVARENASNNGGNGGTGAAAGMGATAGADGSTMPPCPDDAPNCPPGCIPRTGYRYSLERGCVMQEREIVACNGISEGPTTCIKRVRDGAVFLASASPLETPAWTPCSSVDTFGILYGCGDRTCTAPQVNTVAGCLACEEAASAATAKLGSAHALTSRCQASADCVCVPSSTRCAGACDVGVSAEFTADYREMVRIVDQQYCSDPAYGSICGRVTPRCVPCVPSCEAGVCTSLPAP
jgi:hypothetical protein